MKKSELKAMIKRELLSEGFDGFNGVVSLGATNRMTSLTEMEDEMMYGSSTSDASDEAITKVLQDALDKIEYPIAEGLQDALDKIEDTGVSVADEGRRIQDIFNKSVAADVGKMFQDIFNKLITQSSRELDI